MSLPNADLTRVLDDEIAWADGVGYYTLHQPALKSSLLDQPASWDPILARWLPVAPALVAPDGRSYVWTEIPQAGGASSRIHKVDVATGVDTVVMGKNNLVASSYQTDAIYLVNGFAGETGFHSSTGLWRLDLATLGLRELAPASGGYWGESGLGDYISHGSAWRTEYDPGDPAPQVRASGGFSQNRLVRLDLVTGTTSVWLTRHGAEVAMVGVDEGGHPLVAVHAAQTTEWWSLDGPETGTLVYRGPFSGDGLGPYDDGTSGGYRPHGLMVDSHGLWISASPAGQLQLYVYTSGHVQTVQSPGTVDAVHNWYPAGACA